MADKRQSREWIKVQLGDDEESRYTGEIVAYWKSLRTATRLIRRAIVVYYALQNGNTDPLYSDFPELAQRQPAQAAPAPEPPTRPARATIARQAVQKSADEDKDDLLDGFGL